MASYTIFKKFPSCNFNHVFMLAWNSHICTEMLSTQLHLSEKRKVTGTVNKVTNASHFKFERSLWVETGPCGRAFSLIKTTLWGKISILCFVLLFIVFASFKSTHLQFLLLVHKLYLPGVKIMPAMLTHFFLD